MRCSQRKTAARHQKQTGITMLYATPTKRGTGLQLFGHRDDLENLHETLHFLCGGAEGEIDRHEHALSLAYEIRKAFEGQREQIDSEYGTMFGTRLTWPHVIFYTSYFRQLAGFRSTNKEHQSNLARLEYCVESALLEYEPKTGLEVVSMYPTMGALAPDFYDSYLSHILYIFLFESGSGKMRFRRLPVLLESLSPLSQEYRQYAAMLERESKKQGCSPHVLHDSREWPDIEW